MRKLGVAVITLFLLVASNAFGATKPEEVKLTPVGAAGLRATWACGATCASGSVGFSYILQDQSKLPFETVAKGEVGTTTHEREFTGLTSGHEYEATIGTCLHVNEAGECSEWPIPTGTAGAAEKAPISGCFAEPEKKGCGYPGPKNTGPYREGVAKCSSLPVSKGNITLTGENETLEGKTVEGKVALEGKNEHVKNSCIISNESPELTMWNGEPTVENTAIRGTSMEGSHEEAIADWAENSELAVLRGDYIDKCGECIHDYNMHLEDSYVLDNGSYNTAAHLEATYTQEEHTQKPVVIKHDTLLVPVGYNGVEWYGVQATIFGAVTEGAENKPCSIKYTVTESLLAGGQWIWSPCSHGSNAGTSELTFTKNRVARCLGETRAAKVSYYTECTDIHEHTANPELYREGDGHGFFPYGGLFGFATEGEVFGKAEHRTCTEDFWDDKISEATPAHCGEG